MADERRPVPFDDALRQLLKAKPPKKDKDAEPSKARSPKPEKKA